jgi:surface carbohydrate biosynthesis protein
MKKIVFLPIETKNRELDAKMALASKLVNDDVDCIIGQHNLLNEIVHLFDGGIYIGKNIFLDAMKSTNEIRDSYKDNNFSILWYHEEGAIYGGDEAKWRLVLEELLDPARLFKDDVILCWGDFQKDFFARSNPQADIHVVGGYRFDIKENSLIRKLLQANPRIAEKDYVLINTNFTAGNHYLKDAASYKAQQEDSKNDLTNKHRLLVEFADDTKRMGFFGEMVSYLLIKNPDTQFVLRPHPTELIEFWENLFHGYKNIKITNEYSAVEWIDRCSFVIQSGCTTALESYCLGKPIINYYPLKLANGIDLTEGLSTLCKTPEEVNQRINASLPHNQNEEKSHHLKSLISNFKNDASSIQMIADIAKDVLKKKNKSKIRLSKINFIIKKIKLINFLKYYPRFLFAKKLKAYHMYISHFPGLKIEEINSKVKTLNRSREQSMDLNFISDELFILSSSKRNLD